MDVHPPDHALHSWRDFFVHIATIVVGLFIAVCLEQTVELFHHRHQAEAARESIHAEASANLDVWAGDLTQLASLREQMRTNIATLRQYEKGAHPSQPLTFHQELRAFRHGALSTARSSATLSLLPSAEVETYAGAEYSEDRATELIFIMFAELDKANSVLERGHSQAELTPEERDELIKTCSLIITNASFLMDNGPRINGNIKKAAGFGQP